MGPLPPLVGSEATPPSVDTTTARGRLRLMPSPCSLELATLVLLEPPSLPLPSPPLLTLLLPLLPPLPTLPPLPSLSLPPVSTPPTSPSPATPEPFLLPLPSLPLLSPPLPLPPLPSPPLVWSEATPPSVDTTTARGRVRPSPTLATPVLVTDTLVPTATASLPPASTLPTSLSLAGDSTKQTSTANFVIHSALKNEKDTVWCQFSSRKN